MGDLIYGLRESVMDRVFGMFIRVIPRVLYLVE